MNESTAPTPFEDPSGPAPTAPPRSRLLVWLGPGADDSDAWSWAIERPALRLAVPEQTEHALGRGDEGDPRDASTPWDGGTRGFFVREGRLVGADVRRPLRSLAGPQALVVQVVREPSVALRCEVRRAQIAALAARWNGGQSQRTRARLAALPTAESLYDRLLPHLHFDRRGQAITPARGRRLVLDRDELHDPRSLRLRRVVEDWLGPDARGRAWENCEPRADHDLTEALELVSRGPVEVDGARLAVRIMPARNLVQRPDLVELARVPSIAARVPFTVDDSALALTMPVADFERLPRGVRQALTATGVCQHRLEENWLPRWIERTAQIHHELGDELTELTPRLAARLRADLAEDLERVFSVRPTLEGRWGMLSHRALAR